MVRMSTCGRILSPYQAKRFNRARFARDDWALIGAQAAIQFQQTLADIAAGRYRGDVEYLSQLALDAWGDAINGGIVVC